MRPGCLIALEETPGGLLLRPTELPELAVWDWTPAAVSFSDPFGRDPRESERLETPGLVNMRRLGDALQARLRAVPSAATRH